MFSFNRYNGIGLHSARGSGTNGYIQRNLAYIKPREQQSTYKEEISARGRSPDRSILEHDQKRKIELEIIQLQDELEDKGIPESEIESKCSELRHELLNRPTQPINTKNQFKGHQTHTIAAAKALEMQRIDHAFNTNTNYKEGDAFDRDLQERKRLDRAERREHHQAMRIQREREGRQSARSQVERDLDERERDRDVDVRRSPGRPSRRDYRYDDRSKSPDYDVRRSPAYDSKRRSPSPNDRGRSLSPYSKRAALSRRRSLSDSKSPLPQSPRRRNFTGDTRASLTPLTPHSDA
ncbi:hypothetical protein E3P91_00470 [Wallemia ichthyophaga]|nr:hypothetical protein E3P91_00470 [Wallemia ichthyophaga]TIB65204.1 hypothetical protein E3P78_00722 [Wallemia ichthyophaga]